MASTAYTDTATPTEYPSNLNIHINMQTKPTIRTSEGKLHLEFDGCQVNGSLDELVNYCLSLPEVMQLNPGSDYTEQYYTIECSAEAVCIIFRKEV